MYKISTTQIADVLLAAAVSLQALQGTDQQHAVVPAVLQNWLPVAEQNLSVAISNTFCTPGAATDPVSVVPALTTVMTSLMSFGQTDIWLGDLPCRVLADISKQSFDKQSKLLWARFVWGLAVSWQCNQDCTTSAPAPVGTPAPSSTTAVPPPTATPVPATKAGPAPSSTTATPPFTAARAPATKAAPAPPSTCPEPMPTTPLGDDQLQHLQDVLATACEDQPVIQTLLMLTATVCQLQVHLATSGKSSPPIIGQLFGASRKAAVSKLAILQTSDLKTANDNDLLSLSALALHLSQKCLPSDVDCSNVKAGLKALLDEMERRMQDQTKTYRATQAGPVGSDIHVLVKPRAPHPITTFLGFSPKDHVFRAEIVEYIADTDRYEVKMWPTEESTEWVEYPPTGNTGDYLAARYPEKSSTEWRNAIGFRPTSSSAMTTNRSSAPQNNRNSMCQPLSASSQWAAVARAIQEKL